MSEPDEQAWWLDWARTLTPPRAGGERRGRGRASKRPRVARAPAPSRDECPLWLRLEEKTGDTLGTYNYGRAVNELRALLALALTVEELDELVDVYWPKQTWQGRKGQGPRFFTVRGEVGQYRAWKAQCRPQDELTLVPDEITDEWERMRYLSRRSNGGS